MTAFRRLLIAALASIVAAAMMPMTGGELFSSYTPLTVELRAPFNDLFSNGRDGDKYSVTGSLSYVEANGRRVTMDDVTIELRGHTSRRESECAFPKLKLTFHGSDDPVFGRRKTVKVGTHCDDKADGLTPKFGRLPNERSPWREALAYRLLDALGIPTLKVRPARIAYVFTDASNTAETSGPRSSDPEQPLIRNAMFLEDDDDAKARFGATRAISDTQFTTAAEQFSAGDTAQITFAEAMLGNFDWCLRMTADDRYRCDARHPLWNMLAFAVGDRTIPVIYDFDVSGIVTGHHLWFKDVYNDRFLPSRSHAAIEVIGQLQRTRSLFPRAVLDATRAHFSERRSAAYDAVADAAVDDDGRSIARAYLDSFFEAIGSDDAFYRPVVTGRNTTAWSDSRRTTRACGNRSTVPVGTPVSAPLETSGDGVRVVLLDALWHWAPPTRCDAVHQDAVWIDAAAISRDYP